MPAKIFNMPGKIRVLWVGEQRPDAVEGLCGCSVESAADIVEAAGILSSSSADVILTSAELRIEVQKITPDIPVIELPEPVDATDLRCRIQAVIDLPRAKKPAAPWKHFLVGESPAMEDVDRIIGLVGPRRCTVLISGETGTGKEMVARAIHMASPRASQPMVAVNCSALPENLLEAELFGHVKGAFTGATGQRIGRFEQAHNSTLFLDEIGEMPLDLQAKLLRVLQEREFQRLGSSETVKIDVRVIAASNVDLEERVREGRFRADLYYRLNVVPIQMPPLRRRTSDLPQLVSHFIEKVCRLEQMPVKRLAPAAIERLAGYTWPGNVRQLENAVEMAVVLSAERLVLYPGDFPLPVEPVRTGFSSSAFSPTVPFPDGGLDFEQTVNHFERSILEQALQRTRGNKKMAAEMLRLKRTTLSAKLRSLEAAAV
jgi:DNA-binding NtrC family response regulator